MKLIVWEIIFYLTVLAAWFLFRKLAKRNITGDILAGSMLGMFYECATEPLCNYHFKITIYRDIPLAVIFAWGAMFAMVVFFSEKLYCSFLGKKKIVPYDKHIFIFDVLAGAIIGFPLGSMGSRLGLWEYRCDLFQWNWSEIPFFRMPPEILVAYMLIMLTGPTFVRYWQGAFE